MHARRYSLVRLLSHVGLAPAVPLSLRRLDMKSWIGAALVSSAVLLSFRYAFVTDATGLKVVDVTTPTRPRQDPGATIPINDARGIYLVRTYAYIAAGAQGLVIVDIERPERPVVDQTYSADGTINEARDVKVAMTNASLLPT